MEEDVRVGGEAVDDDGSLVVVVEKDSGGYKEVSNQLMGM